MNPKKGVKFHYTNMLRMNPDPDTNHEFDQYMPLEALKVMLHLSKKHQPSIKQGMKQWGIRAK